MHGCSPHCLAGVNQGSQSVEEPRLVTVEELGASFPRSAYILHRGLVTADSTQLHRVTLR